MFNVVYKLLNKNHSTMKKNSLNIHRQTKDSHYVTQTKKKETSINELLYNFKLSKTNVTIYDGISDFLSYVKSQGFKMKIYK